MRATKPSGLHGGKGHHRRAIRRGTRPTFATRMSSWRTVGCLTEKTDPKLGFYEKRKGRISIVLPPGVLIDLKTRRPRLQGIPYDAKPAIPE